MLKKINLETLQKKFQYLEMKIHIKTTSHI